jgi:hypothetical protein
MTLGAIGPACLIKIKNLKAGGAVLHLDRPLLEWRKNSKGEKVGDY